MFSNLTFDSYYGEGDSRKVATFEKMLGVLFPDEYKNIVEKYNGAFIVDKNIFRFYSNLVDAEVEYGSGMFLAYGEIPDVTETMEIKYKHPPEGFVEGLVMFSALGNGDALCFDYREKTVGGDPKVVVWHHEGTPGEMNEISFVAESFKGLLDILYEEED